MLNNYVNQCGLSTGRLRNKHQWKSNEKYEDFSLKKMHLKMSAICFVFNLLINGSNLLSHSTYAQPLLHAKYGKFHDSMSEVVALGYKFCQLSSIGTCFTVVIWCHQNSFSQLQHCFHFLGWLQSVARLNQPHIISTEKGKTYQQYFEKYSIRFCMMYDQ